VSSGEHPLRNGLAECVASAVQLQAVSDLPKIESGRPGELWAAVDRLLAGASPEGVRAHRLGPLEALRRQGAGEDVPEVLAAEARVAAFAMLSVRPLLHRIRASCDGRLVLMKGPEIAIRYPGAARAFVDLDLLTDDADLAYRQLRASGFVEAGDPEVSGVPQHVPPLKWPDLPLFVEMHGHPHWPDGLPAPSTGPILDAAVTSALGVDGILAPEKAQHALIVAAHSWAHEPLRALRDLIDVRVLSAEVDPEAIGRTAEEWRIGRLWRTTDRVTDAVLNSERMPFLAGLWAKHLPECREPTVLENHLRAWSAAYCALPVESALMTTARAARSDILRAPEEGWPDKISRMLAAARNATSPLSRHEHQLGDAATRGRVRKQTEGDAAAAREDAD
jgi:Uncharacterised nucleotidyltransferase